MAGAMSDRLQITGLEIFAHHGVFEHERREGQTFIIDLVLGLDTRAAAGTDDLAQTVNYGTLVDRVVAAVGSDPVDLIETVAARIADLVLNEVLVDWVEVTVHKPHAPIKATFADVALTISRRRT